VAMFMMAIPLSSVLGAPLSTSLLGVSILGLQGWQTMFLLEGIPAALLGVVVFFRMTDRPAVATWLSAEEKSALQRALDRDAPAAGAGHLEGLGAAIANPQVWRFALVYFGVIMGNYGLGFWLPQIVKNFGGLSNLQTGFLTALPYLLAAIGMVLWGRHADRTQERVWHFFVMGIMKEVTGAYGGGLLALAASAGVAALLAIEWRAGRKPAQAAS
jgi:MFS transporter, ACS family, tartrate transporter